jgi:multidrug efflux pump subunit AcrA (membrane-fusion protein)
MKRFFPWIGLTVVLLIVASVVRQCRTGGGANYQSATVTRGPITQAVTATGTLNPVVNVQVGSQVSGNIAKLFVDFNSQVKAGQVVAQIDPALFQATVTQAEGDLANTQAALELQGKRETHAGFCWKTSSQADLDQAMANLHQAEANVKIKQGALDKAKADLEHCTITSPIDGVVISRNVDVGQTVAASLQAPVIFQIANDLTKCRSTRMWRGGRGRSGGGAGCRFHSGRLPDAHVPRQGRASAKRANHGAKRGDLRHVIGVSNLI